jgi:hypothetical protein
MDQRQAHERLFHVANNLGDYLVRLSQTRPEIRDDERLAELTELLHDAVAESQRHLSC